MIQQPTKPVNVEIPTHQRIYELSEKLRRNTGLRHPAYVVVRMAIGLLEDQLGIAPQNSGAHHENRD